MLQAVIITVIVLALAGLAGWSLHHRSAARREATARMTRAAPDRLWEDLLAPHAALGTSLRSLFRDDDYRWLRSQEGLAPPAQELKRRRIRLARRYLSRLRGDFGVLLVLHGLLAREGKVSPEVQDQVAALALRFQFKITLAMGLLPLNYLRLNLSPLRDLCDASAEWHRLVTQARPAVVPAR
jgi:hypothetical protein